MTPKELMLAALRGESTPRIPVATYNFHPLAEVFQRPAYRPMLEAFLEAKDVGVLCKTPVHWRGGLRERMRKSTHTERGMLITTTILDTPRGELVSRHAEPPGQPGYTVEHFVKDDGDIEKLMSLPLEPAAPDLEEAKEWHEKLGEKGLNYIAYSDPLYSVVQWFDFEDFCMRCCLDLATIKALVEREFERSKQELQAMLEQAKGYPFLFYTAGPEVATPPMLSPALFAQLVTPYERELVDMIRAAGQLSAIHCHGKVRMVFEEFKKIGPDALEPMEPPPQGDISLAEALERAGDMCLMGYIQDQDLYTAQPGEMREKVRAICELVKARGLRGYIMTSTATPYMYPPPAAFVRNYIEYLQAAQELG